MYQTKRVGVQRLAWSAAEVLHRLAVQRSVVDRFSTDAMPSFRKVDANLVGATCLQLAFDHRVLAASEGLHRFDMRDGMLCRWIFGRSASSDSITPIAHQHALDRLGCNLAMDHGAIATIDSVVPKEFFQGALGLLGSCEQHQPTGVAIESMDRDDPGELRTRGRTRFATITLSSRAWRGA